jgi:hypothetical protein
MVPDPGRPARRGFSKREANVGQVAQPEPDREARQDCLLHPGCRCYIVLWRFSNRLLPVEEDG